MTLFLVLLAVVMVGAFLFFSRRKEADLSPVIREKVISERNIGGLAKMTITNTLTDLKTVKKMNAEKIIQNIRTPKTIEEKLIVDEPIAFVYFARFFDSRIGSGDTKPIYVDEDDHYRRRYEQAVLYGLCIRGDEISTLEILQTLRLRKELNQLSERSFSRIKEAIEYLSQLPDIDNRLDQLLPRKNYFKLKNIILDMDYIESQWEIIDKT